MPHIHTDPGQFDFTASAYIVLLEDGYEPRIWLHEHKRLNKLLQFGGHIELDETPWQTVCHEVTEESGYEMSQLQILQPAIRMGNSLGTATQPVPVAVNSHHFGTDTTHMHTDLGYAFVTHEYPRLRVGEHETGKLRLYTAADIQSLGQADIPQNVRDEALFIFEHILPTWQRVACAEFDISL